MLPPDTHQNNKKKKSTEGDRNWSSNFCWSTKLALLSTAYMIISVNEHEHNIQYMQCNCVLLDLFGYLYCTIYKSATDSGMERDNEKCSQNTNLKNKRNKTTPKEW